MAKSKDEGLTQHEIPVFSRCKVGRLRWQWVVHQNDGLFDGSEPMAQGISDSANAAYKDAVAEVGEVCKIGNWLAVSFRRKQAALKRREKESNSDNAASLEFVYHCDDGFDTKHRIVKRTKKRIYVDRERWTGMQTGEWYDYDQRTFILDRQEFEKNGKADRKWQTYYADPAIYHAEQRGMASCPEFLSTLELTSEATLEDVHVAYRRLARSTHPDYGGDANEFKKLTAAFEMAVKIMNGN